MKIVIIGSGISGLTAAWYLNKQHDVVVLESADRIGGHTATIDVQHNGERHAIDTGFIVYNDRTYPNYIALLNELGVEARPSEMSFSVSCEDSGIEYAGSNANTLFADRRNLLRPGYWRMLLDIVKFNRSAIADLESNRISSDATLGEYLADKGYGKLFAAKYLVPMGAAIWSSGEPEMMSFPLLFFVRFFKNHGLLALADRPQWRTIVGGSKAYLEPLTRSFSNNIYTGVQIEKIERADSEVTIEYISNRSESRGDSGLGDSGRGEVRRETYDALVIATHSDQALALLEDTTTVEREVLSAIPYQSNEVVLHTDDTLLPARKRAWASWNYRISAADTTGVPLARLTYNMNILQGLETDTTFCVSLNQTGNIDPEKVIDIFHYSHPVYTLDGVKAQSRWAEVAGNRRTWFCGAYWGSGFHEDGVVSALKVVESINNTIAQNSGKTGNRATSTPVGA